MARPLNKREFSDEIRLALVRMCKNALVDGFVVRVEGLIGVTLGDDNVFLINIREDFVNCKPDRLEEHHLLSSRSSENVQVAARRYSAEDVGEASEVDHRTYPQSTDTIKDSVSKLDVLVRYSTDMFNQFSRDVSKKRERKPASHEDHQKLRKSQMSSRADEQNKDIHAFSDFMRPSVSFEKDFSYHMDQCFSIKEEPVSQTTLEESMTSREMLNAAAAAAAAASVWPVTTDETLSRKSSSLGLPPYDIPSTDNEAGSEQLITDDSKTGDMMPSLGFLQQQSWMGGAFEAFPAPNGIGDNFEHRPFVCELCDASFTKKFCLANHIVTIHQVGGKYVCKHCGKQFLQKLRYLTHMDRHNNIRRHVCQLCGKAFSYKYSLWSHAKKCIGSGSDVLKSSKTMFLEEANEMGGNEESGLLETVAENNQ